MEEELFAMLVDIYRRSAVSLPSACMLRVPCVVGACVPACEKADGCSTPAARRLCCNSQESSLRRRAACSNDSGYDDNDSGTMRPPRQT